MELASVMPAKEVIAAAAAEMVNNNVVDAQFSDVNQKIITFKTQLTELQQQMKTLEKTIKKENKVAQAVQQAQQIQPPVVAAKKTRKIGSFDLPEYMSDELCAFLNIPVSEDNTHRNQISRAEATKQVLNYIQQENLQDKTDRVNINPDAKLSNLFKFANDPEGKGREKLTYFNIHKYLNYHFTQYS
jgi:5-bromo-4-chloroindolyl phosphate hydrolysis protein